MKLFVALVVVACMACAATASPAWPLGLGGVLGQLNLDDILDNLPAFVGSILHSARTLLGSTGTLNEVIKCIIGDINVTKCISDAAPGASLLDIVGITRAVTSITNNLVDKSADNVIRVVAAVLNVPSLVPVIQA